MLVGDIISINYKIERGLNAMNSTLKIFKFLHSQGLQLYLQLLKVDLLCFSLLIDQFHSISLSQHMGALMTRPSIFNQSQLPSDPVC